MHDLPDISSSPSPSSAELASASSAEGPDAPPAPPPPAGGQPACRSCGAGLRHGVVDLGVQPPCQRHIEPADLDRPEVFRTLKAYVCEGCFLVQLGRHVDPRELFTDDYAYFSSYSDTWLAHAAAYVEMATARFGLGPRSQVVEVASNDGYLLQGFVQRGIPVLGVEPCANVAEVARGKGVPTLQRFFGVATARALAAQQGPADLIIGNNVLAHVPDLHDFVGGLAALLAPGGAITLEFPHLARLLEGNQFDTIYHEHVSYLALGPLVRLFARHGLETFDVDELPTHGGSLRVYARRIADGAPPPSPAVDALLRREREAGLEDLRTYTAFEERARATKRKLLTFLIAAKERGKTVVAYGAPGKGSTLLNYCGIRTDLVDYTVDRSPHKQGRYMPGTRIPILHPDRILETRPDYVLILPWNLREEVARQMAGIGEWGGQFVVPIPEVEVFSPARGPS